MKLTDYIVDVLERESVNVVFGYMGGMITHLVDSICSNKNIRFIQTYHEQSASIAAEGYAIGTQNIGVAIATSGPGATNMMTGIADAYFDSIPTLYITGQVNTYEYKNNSPVRQLGFQETDVVSLVTPITKYAVIIKDASRIRYELEKAIYIAKNGRPGPVLLDIPMDIQRTDINISDLIGFEPEGDYWSQNDINYVKNLIQTAHRPMILIGGGSIKYKALVNSYIQKHRLPVISSLKGLGIVNEDNLNNIGMIGSYGNRCANMSIANADLLIVLGSRLDTRQTGAMFSEFLKKGKIIHVDLDINELEYNRLENRIKIHSDVGLFLKEIEDIPYINISKEWNRYLLDLKEKYGQDKEIERFVENKTPYKFIQLLDKNAPDNTVYCVDIGQNQMWAAQTLKLRKEQIFITSGGHAPMGFAIPVAVGMAFSDPNRDIYCICGDGGFHIALQSLMLISQYNLPIKVIVLNNHALGMITQFQQLYFDGRMSGTTFSGGYEVPNIRHISESYHLPYFRLEEHDFSNHECITKIFSERYCIIECNIEGFTTVSPKLEYNKPIERPIPLLPDDEFRDSINLNYK